MLLSLLIPLAMAGDLADLTHVTIGYGAALSEVVHDTAGWSDADLEAAALSEDWRTAHQARVVLAWRANAETAALYWQPEIDGAQLPDTKTCMERAGINGEVAHTAVEDAQVVVRLIRQAIDNRRTLDLSDAELAS